MTVTTDIAGLLSQDRLDEALEAAIARIKSVPNDAEGRVILAQLAALKGDLARAETHAKMAQTLDGQRAVALGAFRQALRGLEARSAWWNEGAVPDIPGGPSDADRHAIALNVCLRAGEDPRPAADALEDARAPCPGKWNGNPFDDLRDLDDRLPHAIEAVTTGGAYLWLPHAAIARIDLAPLAAPFDLLARPARIVLRDGSAADLRLLAIYEAPRDTAERLARRTDFTDLPGGLTRAHGQRALLVGDAMRPLHDATEVLFDV